MIVNTNAATGDVLFSPIYDCLIMSADDNTKVWLSQALSGNKFIIYVVGIDVGSNKTKTATISSTFPYPVTNIINLTDGNCIYDNTNKTYTFSANGEYTFIPINPLINSYFIKWNK